MMILALDVSLTATGYARGPGAYPQQIAGSLALPGDGWGDQAAQVHFGTLVPPKTAASGLPRLQWIRRRVLELASGCDLIALEGYSFASKGRAVISLGELGGVLRLALFEAGVPVVEIAPSTRAKYATGKGNAGKEEVLASAIRRLGYTGHDNNQADALWLWTMAAERCGVITPPVPRAHRVALETVRWPELSQQTPAIRPHVGGVSLRTGTEG